MSENKKPMCKNMYIITLQLTWFRNWIFLWKKMLTLAFFHSNRKSIYNFLKYIVITWIVSSFFLKNYETFLLFNLASVFCFGTTMCHFIIEKNLLPPNWLANQKKSLLERFKELKKTLWQKLYFKVVILSKYVWTVTLVFMWNSAQQEKFNFYF